jgi:hypothetical protein
MWGGLAVSHHPEYRPPLMPPFLRWPEPRMIVFALLRISIIPPIKRFPHLLRRGVADYDPEWTSALERLISSPCRVDAWAALVELRKGGLIPCLKTAPRTFAEASQWLKAAWHLDWGVHRIVQTQV